MSNHLYILCGIPFSGKTTLARKIAKLKGYLRVDLDDIKTQVVGADIKDSNIAPSSWDKVYQTMYEQIKLALSEGQTVIHDTGNFTSHERSLISRIATKLRLPFTTIYVNTPTDIAHARLLANRQNPTRFNITDEEFSAAACEMEVPSPRENPVTYSLGTDLTAWIAQYLP